MKTLFTRRGFSVFVPLFDLTIVYISIFLTYFYFKDSLRVPQDTLDTLITMSPYIGFFYLIIGHIFELDKPKEFTLFGVAYSIIISILCLLLITTTISFLTEKTAYPRSILVVGSFFQIILLIPWHLYVNKLYLKENTQKTVVVIGYDKAKEIVRKLLSVQGMWSNIKMICPPESPKLKEYIQTYDSVFLTEDVSEDTKQKIAEFCIKKNKQFFYVPKYQEIFLFNASYLRIDDTLTLKARPFNIDPENDMFKRAMDIILSLVGIIVFLVPGLLIALSLKIGGGSIFYKQERITKGGKVFFIYKFRTMIENAEASSGPVLAGNKDTRITRLGHFLRATRLDEMPQFYNILIGEMSVVGPRPERPFFVDNFCEKIPEYNLRHRVKAGLTGLAQVQGKYNTSVEEKLKYDLHYINNYSIALDIKLIMRTLTILLDKNSTEGIKEQEDYEDLIEQLMEK